VPNRPFVGLGWLVGWAVAYGYLMRLIELWLTPNREPFSHVYLIETGLTASLVAAVTLSCRHTLRWRIAAQSNRPELGPSQFSLAAIIELSACLGLVFGFSQLIPDRVWTIRFAISVLIQMVHMLLLVIPAARVVLANPPPTPMALVGLSIWSVAVTLAAWSGDLRLVPFYMLIQMWHTAVIGNATIFAVLFVNLIIIRRLGYRWYGNLIPVKNSLNVAVANR
jgi:hypothetical protein